MDKYTEEYALETEGINGLRLISRDAMPYERARKVKGDLITVQGDRRYETRNGVYTATQDYMISGEGRPPVVIREVPSDFQGMKKYALIDMRDVYDKKSQGRIRKAVSGLWERIFGKKDNIPYVDVCFIYSEGLDIEKMISDSSYAEMVIGLLGEERISQLRGAQKDCYIGTIQENDEGYSKMIRPNPQAVMQQIRMEIARQEAKTQEDIRQAQQKHLAESERRRGVEEAINIAENTPEWKAKIIMGRLYEILGRDAYVKIQEEIVEREKKGTTLKEELIASGDYKPYYEGVEQEQ